MSPSSENNIIEFTQKLENWKSAVNPYTGRLEHLYVPNPGVTEGQYICHLPWGFKECFFIIPGADQFVVITCCSINEQGYPTEFKDYTYDLSFQQDKINAHTTQLSITIHNVEKKTNFRIDRQAYTEFIEMLQKQTSVLQEIGNSITKQPNEKKDVTQEVCLYIDQPPSIEEITEILQKQTSLLQEFNSSITKQPDEKKDVTQEVGLCIDQPPSIEGITEIMQNQNFLLQEINSSTAKQPNKKKGKYKR